LAFIDGAHDRESVLNDIARVCEVLSGDGLIAFHDYKQPHHPGVSSAVDSFIDAGAELISLTNTLAVVKPPAVIPLEV
jgi:hypothetical protein